MKKIYDGTTDVHGVFIRVHPWFQAICVTAVPWQI
jgi:hypothetical protein